MMTGHADDNQLNKTVKALTNPTTQEEWLQAMNNPLSPIYQQMMALMTEKQIEKSILFEVIEIRMQMNEAERQREKEELIDAILKEQASKEEKMLHIPAEAPHVPVADTNKIEQLKQYVEECDVKIAKLGNEISQFNTSIREINSQIKTLENQWKVTQQKHHDEFKQLLHQSKQDPEFEVRDKRGNVIQINDDFISKMAEISTSSYSNLLTNETKQPKEIELKMHQEKMMLQLWNLIDRYKPDVKPSHDVTQLIHHQDLQDLSKHNPKISSLFEAAIAKHFHECWDHVEAHRGLVSHRNGLMEDLMMKRHEREQHIQNRDEAMKMIKQLTSELIKQSDVYQEVDPIKLRK